MFSIFFITFRVAVFAISDLSRIDHDVDHVQDVSEEVGVVGQVHHAPMQEKNSIIFLCTYVVMKLDR